MSTPELIRDPAEWQLRLTDARDGGTRIALVPTMGYLHEGHLSLMRESRHRADSGARRGLSVATIFVNPTQFGPSEDLARYPRDLEGDLAKCGSAGVDLVLAPEDPKAMYLPGFQTWVDVEEVSKGLCGERRPGHFRGVATVVAKLLGLSRPHVALFGDKDWQQLQVIRRMVLDLDMGVEVVGMPIVREPDGLALSSRNAYLSPDERARAPAISRALAAAQVRAAGGERDPRELAAGIARAVEEAGMKVDYVELVHPETLRPAERAEPGTRALVAAFLGRTRLIDNLALP
jgi:pantoate--beta-alanine ligase